MRAIRQGEGNAPTPLFPRTYGGTRAKCLVPLVETRVAKLKDTGTVIPVPLPHLRLQRSVACPMSRL